MKKIIRLCGRLSEAGFGEKIELTLAAKTTARQTLHRLASLMGPKASWLKGAALATDSEILLADDVVPEKGNLAVLPPVCGG